MESNMYEKVLITKKFSSLIFASLLILWAELTWAAASAWRPIKAIEVVVPGGAGGGIDSTARAIQRVFQEKKLLETPFTIVNKPGGSASVGLTYLSQLPSDGHHIAMGSGALLTNHITGRSALHTSDFTPLVQLFSESISFAVRAESSIKSGRDLLARLKVDPGSVRIGLPSVASTNHIACALVLKSLGVDPKTLKTVIFNSSAAGITALLGGHIELVASPAANTISHIQAGTLRVVAISSEKRLGGAFAEVLTLKELGSNVVIGAFRSAIGPKGMSREAVAYWERLFSSAVQTKEWQDYLTRQSLENNFMDSKDSAIFLSNQYKELYEALSDLGLARTSMP
ncbi:MAG: tripartite tricarboxylate transporter substrate binding protein [Burkholderiales bacterium]|nr:tripartite tricarboxylate transporter substrate binding protein [Burkholderiales bacterium]